MYYLFLFSKIIDIVNLPGRDHRQVGWLMLVGWMDQHYPPIIISKILDKHIFFSKSTYGEGGDDSGAACIGKGFGPFRFTAITIKNGIVVVRIIWLYHLKTNREYIEIKWIKENKNYNH
jgi:hypothetical protein